MMILFVTSKGLATPSPTKLRFENKKKLKLKSKRYFLLMFYLFVTSEGFEPPTLRAEI